MCGLAGILVWDERFRVTRDTLQRVSARIAHRGPDAQGIFLSPDRPIGPANPQVALVHRRLSILDPDPRADQPFVDSLGRLIVFNGEIYNFRELRREITGVRPDYQWRTNCDTEVLLAAYSVWGEDSVRQLNGMYAFAIWDPAVSRLFLARDRMGQKPLYYAYDPRGAFAFASEPNALRSLDWLDTSVDPQAIVDYLTWACTPRGTVYRGIDKLPPGTCATITPSHSLRERDGVRVEPLDTPSVALREWSPSAISTFNPHPALSLPGRGFSPANAYFDPNDSPETAPRDLPSAISRARQLVLQAVARQLVSDVPLGCFLSGGIDSSIVTAAIRAAVPREQPVLTFSIGFDDPRYDETTYAAAVAKHLGTEHRQFIVRPNAAEDLPRLAAHFGEPFGDSSALPTHYISRETRQFVKVAVSGDGGDELFGGYDRYRAMSITGLVPRWIWLVASPLRLLPGSHPKSSLTRLKRLFASAPRPPAQRYAGYLRLFDPATIAAILEPMADVSSMIASSQSLLTERFDQLMHGGRNAVQSALAIDRVLYLPEDLLTKVDRCSMLHALEVRSPFMDHELVHFAANLPTNMLLNGGGKRLLREAFAADLPRGLFDRPKMGFAVPIGEWLRTSLRDVLRDALFASDSFASRHFNRDAIDRLIDEHQGERCDHSQRLYALLMLELWWEAARNRD